MIIINDILGANAAKSVAMEGNIDVVIVDKYTLMLEDIPKWTMHVRNKINGKYLSAPWEAIKMQISGKICSSHSRDISPKLYR